MLQKRTLIADVLARKALENYLSFAHAHIPRERIPRHTQLKWNETAFAKLMTCSKSYSKLGSFCVILWITDKGWTSNTTKNLIHWFRNVTRKRKKEKERNKNKAKTGKQNDDLCSKVILRSYSEVTISYFFGRRKDIFLTHDWLMTDPVEQSPDSLVLFWGALPHLCNTQKRSFISWACPGTAR